MVEKIKTKKQRKGITLVSLVVTIIILLILAGITINLTIGEDGIIRRAQEAGENYINASDYERNQLAEFLNDTDKIIANVTDKTTTNGTGGSGTNQTDNIEKIEYLIKDGIINTELFSNEINSTNSPTLTYERGYIFFQSYSELTSTVTFKTPIYLKDNQIVLIKYANNNTNNTATSADIGLKKDDTASYSFVDVSTIDHYSDKDVVHTNLLTGFKNQNNYLFIASYNTRSFKIYDVAIVTMDNILEDTSLYRTPLIPVVMTYNETLSANCSGATNSHRAFDGKKTTGAVANVGKYVQYKFSESVNFNEVYLEIEVPTGTTRTESIQYSIDGEEWFDIVESHTFTETDNTLVVSNLNINANYIRANALESSDGGKHTVLNFQIYKVK